MVAIVQALTARFQAVASYSRGMSNGIPLTPERKAAFLAELARHGIAVRAARAASPQSAQGALSPFTHERQRDPAFAAAVEEALAPARAEVDHEFYRRADNRREACRENES